MDHFSSRFESYNDEGVSVGVAVGDAEVDWKGHIAGSLFHRAQLIGKAYDLHVLPGIEVYDETHLTKAQCQAMVDEIEFVIEVVNDPLLRTSVKPLHDASLECSRSPFDARLIVSGP